MARMKAEADATLPSLRGQQACDLVRTQGGRSGFHQKTRQPKRWEWTSSDPVERDAMEIYSKYSDGGDTAVQSTRF